MLLRRMPRLAALLDVLLVRRLELERLRAVVASERPIVGMRRQVVLQAGHLAKRLVADVAAERLVARVYPHVLAQDVLRLERLLADVARVLRARAAHDQADAVRGGRGAAPAALAQFGRELDVVRRVVAVLVVVERWLGLLSAAAAALSRLEQLAVLVRCSSVRGSIGGDFVVGAE